MSVTRDTAHSEISLLNTDATENAITIIKITKIQKDKTRRTEIIKEKKNKKILAIVVLKKNEGE